MGVEPTFARNAPVWPLTAHGRLPEEAPDPAFFLPDGLLEKGAREAAETIYLNDRNPVLARAPVEPLGPSIPKVIRHGKWHAAIVASLVFHAAVAWFFIDQNRNDVLIEGSENAGITMLGSAAGDQAADGEVEATQVTLIDMVEPKPVVTVTAETVPVVETAEAVPAETAEAAEEVVAEAPVPDTIVAETHPVARPVEAQTARPETVQSIPEEKSAEAVTETPQPASEPVEEAVPVLPSDAPEILAVDKVAPPDDATAVAKPAEAAEPSEAAKAETVETAEAVAAEPVETVRETSEPVEAVKETPPEPEKPVAKPEPKPVEKTVKKAKAKPVETKKPEKKAEKKPTEKPAEKKAAEAQPKKKAAKAGSGGANQADAKRGAADGQESGTTAAKGKKGKTASSGNASVSNYPGKVVSKLRRALRYPAEARAKRLKGEVQVAFTVSASGGVSGVRVVRSSGSPVLDKAALDTVRRAAPFPAIPSDAGRSSWPFTVPLAFVR